MKPNSNKPQKRNIKKRVTMKDIAKQTGYSINTVSHALNDKDDILPETKEYIKKVAEEIGYIGNVLAGSLRSGYSKTIAVIIADISNPYFSIMVKQIEKTLREYEYTTLILSTEEDAKLELNAVKVAIQRGVDGIIICPTQHNKKPIQIMKQNGIPFVLMGRHFEGRHYETVICDDYQSGLLATQHLIDLGHKDIFFINGPDYISSSTERESGYKKALRKNNININENLICSTQLVDYDLSKIIKNLINKNIKCSSIFCFSDILAWDIMKQLKDNNISVPQDYSLVGIDNLQSHLHIPIGLSSIDTGKEQMADLLVASLLRIIQEDRSTSVKQVITPSLVARETTTAI